MGVQSFYHDEGRADSPRLDSLLESLPKLASLLPLIPSVTEAIPELKKGIHNVDWQKLLGLLPMVVNALSQNNGQGFGAPVVENGPTDQVVTVTPIDPGPINAQSTPDAEELGPEPVQPELVQPEVVPTEEVALSTETNAVDIQQAALDVLSSLSKYLQQKSESTEN